MKISWELLMPFLVTAGAALFAWVVRTAINAIGKSITRELNQEIGRLKAENEAMQKNVERNTRRIDFLWERLIERNS